MTRLGIAAVALVLLAGCGESRDDIERDLRPQIKREVAAEYEARAEADREYFQSQIDQISADLKRAERKARAAEASDQELDQILREIDAARDELQSYRP